MLAFRIYKSTPLARYLMLPHNKIMTTNIQTVVENIASLLRPYNAEISTVASADLPYVLRRIQREIRLRLGSSTSIDLVHRYRRLDRQVERSLRACT
jgi:uncharacterized protein YprB with RNaseH-like and TPR domain